jgi:hypothetical protein
MSSYLSPADLEAITQARSDMFDTRLLLRDPGDWVCVMSRYNETTQAWVEMPPRDDIIVKMQSRLWPNTIERQAYILKDATGQEQTRNGILETLGQWDVLVGDIFDMWDGASCVVFDVPPFQDGYQRAWFRLDEGGL